MAKDETTNVMRQLSTAGIPFTEHSYDPDKVEGEQVALAIGTKPDETFKTLVTVSDHGKNYVFVIPVNRELDLKAAARAVGEKAIAMIPQKTLLPLPGYVHGGCSPVGMKKSFPTVFDESCLSFDAITLSAGKRGRQITISPRALIDFVRASTAPLTRAKTKF